MESDARALIVPILKNIPAPVVVELGAQDGDDTEWLFKAAGEGCRYIAVEADFRNANLFRGKFGRTAIRFHEKAIADHDGEVTLYLCSNTVGHELASSSICRPTGHLEYFPWCKFDQTCRVSCITLDSLAESEGLDRIDLLWVDIQGAEGQMIAGGAETLSRTRYLFIEAESKELYENQALEPDLLRMLPDWVVVKKFEWNLLLWNGRLP